MAASLNFHFVTNLLGLNFSCITAPILLVIFVQTVFISFGLYVDVYLKVLYYVQEVEKITIYTMMGFLQIEIFFILQLVFTIRALIYRKYLNQISENVDWKIKLGSVKQERKFFLHVLSIVALRTVRICYNTAWPGVIFMTKTMFAELVVASNDFLFIFFVCLLIKHLKTIKSKIVKLQPTSKRKIRAIKKEILENFTTKRKIEKRFSIELGLSITYNYIQLVIALYWIFVRIKFNRLIHWNRK